MCVAGRGGGHGCGLFIYMDLYIYSDESGTFDARNNDYFIFGGLIILGKQQKDDAVRKYAHVEDVIRTVKKTKNELKACYLSNELKGKVYRSLKGLFRFGVIIHQKDLHPEVFHNKRHKQRYLDFAYKIGLKKAIKHLLDIGVIPKDIHVIHVYCDEHHTCTDGIYELKEALLNEFKNGTFNSNYECFYEPIFQHLNEVELYFCDSKLTYLIRAADIIANHFYHLALEGEGSVSSERNAFIIHLPSYEIAFSEYIRENSPQRPALGLSSA